MKTSVGCEHVHVCSTISLNINSIIIRHPVTFTNGPLRLLLTAEQQQATPLMHGLSTLFHSPSLFQTSSHFIPRGSQIEQNSSVRRQPLRRRWLVMTLEGQIDSVKINKILLSIVDPSAVAGSELTALDSQTDSIK